MLFSNAEGEDSSLSAYEVRKHTLLSLTYGLRTCRAEVPQASALTFRMCAKSENGSAKIVQFAKAKIVIAPLLVYYRCILAPTSRIRTGLS
jgi:hypothetical protein